MIREADALARPGDVVNVYDKAGLLFGRGLYNPRSQIALRMLVHGDTAIDDAFWRGAIERAIELRRRLRLDEVTDAYRLIHAEGDGLSGLIVERYANALVFEFFALGMFQRQHMLAEELTRALGPPTSLDRPQRDARAMRSSDQSRDRLPFTSRSDVKGQGAPSDAAATSAHADSRSALEWRVVFRADDEIQRIEGFRCALLDQSRDRLPFTSRSDVKGQGAGRTASRRPTDSHADPSLTVGALSGGALNSVIIREHGVRYRVDVEAGHKTGFFCDQRENRRRFADLCRDASVLDLCCYTGGFGLCAKLLGGAKDVSSVDLDEAALAVAKENVNLNNTRVNLVHSDAFIYLRQMLANGRQFDAVVLDPPKFVSHREDMDEGLRKYHDLNSLAMQVVRPGGILLTCSCSGLVSWDAFKDAVFRASRPAKRSLQVFLETSAGPDHPVMMNCPESAYLKAMWLRAN
jgi:23S rRNA G2069 N7-methylase RlmK/C1962 C5-methylase RlmI